jgi:hypothetical protein
VYRASEKKKDCGNNGKLNRDLWTKMTEPSGNKLAPAQRPTKLVCYNAFRPVIESTVRDIYHYWFTAEPTNYPPNLHPRVESKEGSIVKRNHHPVVGIGKKEYIRYSACDAKYVETIWEFTPDGKQLSERMILQIKHVNDTYWSFGSCHCCWKENKRNFTKKSWTPHPMRVQVNNENLPRLGQCGCIVCNDCIMKIELHKKNDNNMWVHCPYCGNPDCFSKHVRIWLVSMEVSEGRW